MGAAVWASVITALVTALITASVTLAGVRLTQRHATALRRLDLDEKRRAEQRGALAEAIVTGREWTRIGYVPLAPPEFILDARYNAHARALLVARLVVSDAQLRHHLVDLTKHLDGLTSIASQVGSEQASGVHDPKRAYRHDAVKAYRDALTALEILTRERMLADQMTGSDRHPRVAR
jgi:hypothetical protein